MSAPSPRRPSTSAAPGFADDAPLRPPHPGLVLLEARAPWEFAALLASAPWLRRRSAGDGHPVLVLPGLGASDASTRPLRRLLTDLGYAVHPWRQGFNFGPRRGVMDGLARQLDELADRSGRSASLVGWSLGGLYARELAKLRPDAARCVVTLGTPFTGHPRATHAWRFYEWVSGQSADDPARLAALREPPPVPTTSIYSRSDGIVAWRCSLNEPGPRVENIEVRASHVGMGFNPLALLAVADRLAQDPSRWRPFDARGVGRWFFPRRAGGTPTG